MQLRINILLLFWLLPMLFIVSCINAPVEVILADKFQLTSAQVNEVSDKILKRIIDEYSDNFLLHHMPQTIKAEECKKSFITWISNQFQTGLVPKRNITSEEYMVFSTALHKDACPTIDLEEKFSKLQNKIDLANLGKTQFISLEKLRETISKNGPCVLRYFDPKQQKIAINSIELIVEKNTLNIDLPQYEVLFATKPVTSLEVKASGAASKLKEEGVLKTFAMSPLFLAQETGIKPFHNIGNFQRYQEAEKMLSSLGSPIIAVPAQIYKELPTKKIDGASYFIIPQGEVSMGIRLKASLLLELEDAICVAKYFKKKSNPHHKNDER